MASASFIGNLTCYHITITNADTEYSQELPEGTKYVRIQCQDATAVRIAFETGKVKTPTAPYYTIKASTFVEFGGAFLNKATLYVGCASGSKTLEVLAGY